jgi:hypothetical protein
MVAEAQKSRMAVVTAECNKLLIMTSRRLVNACKIIGLQAKKGGQNAQE